MAVIGGIDGCPAGWLCVSEAESGSVESVVYATAAELLDATRAFDAVTIDIPIGLPDTGPRVCDLQARRLIGPRGSSVFPTPVRAALEGTTYAEACALSRAACGKSLSKQAFAILDRIRDVDDLMRREPELQRRVREVHPEVCFYFWNNEQHLQGSKRSEIGVAERGALISAEFGDVFDQVRASHRLRDVAGDDIRDALAALWTAKRVAAGRAVTIPNSPPVDRYGLRMEMVA